MKLTVRDTKMIEKIALRKDKSYVSEMLAVMFKREDLSNTEHYTDAHIKHKAKLFKQLSADISVPYLLFITNKINKQVEAQATQELESSDSGAVPGVQQD